MSNIGYIFDRLGYGTFDDNIGDDVLQGGVDEYVLIDDAHRDRTQYSESLPALISALALVWPFD